ncbi:translation initiation factor III [Actinoplanes rectilineatus]|uniref:translation initiation factor III n=1 Tax=Actinoplanes rectilineatus TaxID=113571 RepID=UPI0012FCC554|nr:translation initiation factor III [Actinoplanes rectilineatus]
MLVLALCVIAALWAVSMMTAPGRIGYYFFFIYSSFYMGVIALVGLSITIMVGLVSTDRLVLTIRQRVLLQSTHRTTGLIAVSALGVHVWTKFAEGLIGVLDIFIPFLNANSAVGFGVISGWVMVLVMWTGIARSRFIGRGKPWMWRGIHSISYLIWPTALFHGLAAGRAAATWVIVSYIVCVLGVLLGLGVRLSVSFNRRKDFASPAGASIAGGSGNEPGKLVPTASPIASGMRRPGRAGQTGTDLLAPAGGGALGGVTQQWAQPPVAPPAPPAAPPAPPAPPVAEPARAAAPAEEDYPPRRQQPELEAAPPRRRDDDDRYETSTRMSRRDVEDERRRFEDEPRGRGGRAEIYDDEPRSRRRFEDDEPAPRGRRGVEDTGRMRRPELEETSSRMRRSDLEETGTRMRRPEPEETSSRMRRSDLEETGTRMRRYDDEDTGSWNRRRAAAEPDERPRGRRRADDEYEEIPRQRSARYEDDEPRAARSARYDDEPPRRPSRSEFVDFTEDTAALVDSGTRRGRRAEPDDRGARRGRDDDDAYFSQLRGER